MTTSGTVTVEQVDAETTLPLRSSVLRPGRPAAIPGDEDPATLHLAARLPGGRVVGVVRFHPAACTWRAAEQPWQLRGMATDPEVRGAGAGRALVAEGLARLAADGADLVWCDAREAAVGFYERMGFTVVTDTYDVPAVGPHRGMVVELPIR
ncbi:GNAT family N-acetyltransferase [Modestobacter sp. Leaf380]|uniref:GNAT family N-acetyltransferase n=1 Tax=Modestobacter sp. Leaf380 TaxID=1736356 RepID=UPI0006FD6256|nr:GNAT family N-acetyltransferase [Modestobacter sp. Leaf380]KQS68423.1 GCN5 family acetyltransferase [Modestobacter sp. Leaf380]